MTELEDENNEYGYSMRKAHALKINLQDKDGSYAYINAHEKCLKLAAEGNEVAKQVLAEKMRRAMGIYPRGYAEYG
jgi:hypothetical protein